MSVWESIHGETPIDDISGLKIKSIKTRADCNRYEAKNILEAAKKYLLAPPGNRKAPFNATWFKKLHAEMLGDVWSWAGKIRNSNKNIGIDFILIEEALLNLELDLVAWCDSGMPLVEQAVLLHHRAAQIHPFENGNGRWARMLANIWLKKNESQLTKWPEEHVGAVSVIRDEYLKAIREADSGDMQPLIELHRRFTPESG